MLRVLIQNRNFRSLWLGQLVSALGDRLTQMGVLTFVMIAAGDKGDKMALITFFSLLPFLLFGPLFGALVDMYSRKKLMLIADILRSILVVFVPIVWVNTHSVILVIVWVFMLGALAALFAPAKMSIITNITDKDILLEANSMIATTGMVATLVGTLIAGVLIRAAGVAVGFYINSFTYIISAVLILNIVYVAPKRPLKISGDIYTALINDIKFGINYIRRRQMVVRLIFISCIFSLITSFAYILILNYTTVILRQGPLGIGGILSAAGFGMIMGSVILSRSKGRVNYNKLLYSSYFIIGLACMTFLVKPAFYLTLIVLFCAGAGSSVLIIALDTIFQRITPDELKGKIFAARGIFMNMVFLFSLLFVGFLIRIYSAMLIFGIIGLISIITSLGTFLFEKRWGYQLLRLFLKLLMRFWFHLEVSGLENIPKTKRVILAGNHSSILDGLALMCAYPERVYFIVTDSLFETKGLGWCFRKLGYIPVKRGGFNKEAIEEAAGILKSGYSIAIFPEGKIAQDGRLTEGKEGIAFIAKLAGVDIVPFAIEGAYEAWPLPKKFPRRFPVGVRFARPIDISGYSAPQELLEEVMQNIAKVKLFLEREGYLRVNPDDIIRHLINIG